MALGLRTLGIVAVLATTALAQPPSDVLRDGNAAASAGDWARVSALVDPLLEGQLPRAALAEAHRLAGLAAYFQQRHPEAAAHFLAYLRIDLDGRLDPALYPPDAVFFFDDVKTKNAAELRDLRRARAPKPKQYWILNLLPPVGQFQNGERTKAYVIGGLLGAFAIGNVTSYLMLRSWCTPVSGESGPSATCDGDTDRSRRAANLRALNIATGIGVIVTYAYGVYDGVSHYRRETIQPYVSSTRHGGGVFGIAGSF